MSVKKWWMMSDEGVQETMEEHYKMGYGSSTKAPGETKSPVCSWHDWVEYVGITERYDYCKKCDAKRDESGAVNYGNQKKDQDKADKIHKGETAKKTLAFRANPFLKVPEDYVVDPSIPHQKIVMPYNIYSTTLITGLQRGRDEFISSYGIEPDLVRICHSRSSELVPHNNLFQYNRAGGVVILGMEIMFDYSSYNSNILYFEKH